ncbi:RNA polymerase ii subunit 5-mediating protein nnx3 [Anaeramoeba flamelloides]|uniref:RNA polymerase ii subunit 5-mediating protein nnx3 n=1 Tax=Anaeramoeba flamelloides TaxID=1746091 RepID=A0AAV7ZB78_9EUKA|nr:RNA polymerase ii subunit 5-mediating protein nnx3 [Anaeramoeba flamelloides]
MQDQPKEATQKINPQQAKIYQSYIEKRINHVMGELDKLHSQLNTHKWLYEKINTLPNTTHESAYVPFGDMAYFQGEIVHTNEFMVLLGDNYFAKLSAHESLPILQRQTKRIQEGIDKYEEELGNLDERIQVFQKMIDEQEEQQEFVDIIEYEPNTDEEEDEKKKEKEKEKVNMNLQKDVVKINLGMNDKKENSQKDPKTKKDKKIQTNKNKVPLKSKSRFQSSRNEKTNSLERPNKKDKVVTQQKTTELESPKKKKGKIQVISRESLFKMEEEDEELTKMMKLLETKQQDLTDQKDLFNQGTKVKPKTKTSNKGRNTNPKTTTTNRSRNTNPKTNNLTNTGTNKKTIKRIPKKKTNNPKKQTNKPNIMSPKDIYEQIRNNQPVRDVVMEKHVQNFEKPIINNNVTEKNTIKQNNTTLNKNNDRNQKQPKKRVSRFKQRMMQKRGQN